MRTMHEDEGKGRKPLTEAEAIADELAQGFVRIAQAVITRTNYTDKSTAGVLSVTKEDGYAWICKTLELPDKNNASKISCIPKGEYECRFTMSPSFKKFTYEVLNVPNRAGIRIHSGNYTRQILGCILLGKTHTDIDKDGIIDVTESGKTIEEFETIMKHQPFKLIIQ